MSDKYKTSKKKNIARLVFIVVVSLIILAVVSGGVIRIVKTKPELFGLAKGTSQDIKEVEKLISEVEKIIELPKDEAPTVWTVADLEKTKDKPFFKMAKLDDKVLVYRNAKKAFLYRPSEKKIIEVGVVNLDSEPTEETKETSIPVITPTPEVIITPTSPSITPLPTNTPSPTTSQ